ncbi:LPS export ABC transporter permease LptF [Salinicola aestuarinus]|uniref:LPS export ABC transporter permease LptF n=1 Tax=Salinicola aestuarinus TaxID=1949082 RepID=UPI000DA1FADB|nr:LPS export ABC transporter permease LptF [Salinicola aestuarinus]
MIVFRYLTREILLTMSAVAGILLLVIMGSRFIRYFTDAAQGELPLGALGSLMLFHMPSFLELVLPLSFFLAILLAYGQLYLNSEITVLVACGMSPNRLLRVTLLPAAMIAVLVGACSLWATPYGAAKNERLIDEQESQLDFSLLSPGRFQDFGSGRTAYTQSLNDDRSRMQGVFISEQETQADGTETQVLTRAEGGYQTVDPDTGSRYLVLSNGSRYSVDPGSAAGQRLAFGSYAVRLSVDEKQEQDDDRELMSTPALIADGGDEAMAQLQWRLSMPLMIPILTLLALPLSRVNPRQGRFAKLMPAIFLHVSYLSLLLAAQDAIARGSLPASIGMWPIHAVYALFGLVLIRRDQKRGGR